MIYWISNLKKKAEWQICQPVGVSCTQDMDSQKFISSHCDLQWLFKIIQDHLRST